MKNSGILFAYKKGMSQWCEAFVLKKKKKKLKTRKGNIIFYFT